MNKFVKSLSPNPQVAKLVHLGNNIPMASNSDEDNVVALGLTVAVVARRVGVAPATLRTWERRYGICPTDRSQGGHRRYCITDIARLEIMRKLVLSGMPAGEAAKVALSAKVENVSNISPIDPTSLSSKIENLVKTLDHTEKFGHPGGGQVLAMEGASSAARGLAKAAHSLDTQACNQIISASINSRGVIWTWENLISKVLIAIGAKWEQTGEGIEAEHVISESVIGQMRLRADQLIAPVNLRPVLTASAPDELHTIPQYVTAAALAERRISAKVLGARVPYSSLINSVKRLAPAAVLIWAQIPVNNIDPELENLNYLRPSPLMLVAGPGWPLQLPSNFKRSSDLTSTITAITNSVGL
jgi:DNA-binding transcriptional MerR regulator